LTTATVLHEDGMTESTEGQTTGSNPGKHSTVTISQTGRWISWNNNNSMHEWVSSFLTALQHNVGYLVPYY